MPPKVWLITGASSGFGKALTEVLLRKGDIVVATLRTPSVLSSLTTQYPPTQLLVLRLDVTHPSDISAAFARTKEVFGRLDVVFNNAGYAMLGEVEGTPDRSARALMEVNFWGSVNVSRAAAMFFREVNPPGQGGIIFQNSSQSGFLAPPGLAFYCASMVKGILLSYRFDSLTSLAIEGFTESLSREFPKEWNIKICIIQPGAFDTNTITSTQILPTHPAYTDTVTAALRDTFPDMTFDGDPHKFARVLYQIAHGTANQKIPLYLPIGQDTLEMWQERLKKMSKIVADVAHWSVDLKKERGKVDTKL